MESFQGHIERARRSLQVAEQMLNKTYPIVNDPKLILAIAEDIYAALTSSMTALLLKKQKKTGNNSFSDKMDAFKQIAPQCSFQKQDLGILKELHSIMSEHEESSVEFPRKDKFVICDDGYKCTTMTLDDMKSYLFKARLFVEKVSDELEKEQQE